MVIRVIICSLLIASAARADWLSPASSPETAHVFAGTVCALRHVDSPNPRHVATVVVREVWLGGAPDTVVVATSDDRCGAWLIAGNEYVFQAPAADVSGMLTVDACTCIPHDYVRWSVTPWRGIPERVAGGQESRSPTLEESCAILAGTQEGDVEWAAFLIRESVDLLRRLARSPDAGDRRRFDVAVAAVADGVMAYHGQHGSAWDHLLRTLAMLGPLAGAALPSLLSFQVEADIEELGVNYWVMLRNVGEYSPAVRARLAETLATARSPEMRRFALTTSWSVPHAHIAAGPDPADYLEDADREVREDAIWSLTARTRDARALSDLARRVLADPDGQVAERCLPYIIGRLDDEAAVDFMLAALAHPNESVALRVCRDSTFDERAPRVRCSVLRAALVSRHWFIRMWALEYRRDHGQDCG
jgi:hypothetical protein